MSILCDAEVLLVLQSVPQRDRAARLSHSLVCRQWKLLTRANEVLCVHLALSPNASAAPAVLPTFLHHDELGCRIRVGVTSANLPRFSQRLHRAVEMVLLAHRDSVASCRLPTLRLEDYKRGLQLVIPGALFHAASVMSLAAPRVRSASLCTVHLVRCALPDNLAMALAHVRQLRVWDCTIARHDTLATLAKGISRMCLDELCWGADSDWANDSDDDMLTAVGALLTSPPLGLARLLVFAPLNRAPVSWAQLAPSLMELVMVDTDTSIDTLAASLRSFVSLRVLQLERWDISALTKLMGGGLPALLDALPSLVSLGCLEDLEDEDTWLDQLPRDGRYARLTSVAICILDPMACLDVVGMEDEGASPSTCELLRLASGLAVTLPSLQKVCLTYYEERDMVISHLAVALEPLRPLGCTVDLLRGSISSNLLSDDEGLLMGSEQAGQLLSARLAPLRVLVHYEGSKTENCLRDAKWLLEDAVGLCPTFSGFAVPRRTVTHKHPATHYPT